jgi:hypothetical protein
VRFSEEVFGAIEATLGPTLDVSSRLVAHPCFPQIIPEWFLQLYQVMRATTSALEYAEEQVHVNGTGHGDVQFARQLAGYYSRKIVDENGHDELMLKDLEVVGVTAAEAQSAIPSPTITALVGSQYYLIEFIHPAVYLGYIALLEANSLTLEQIEMLRLKSNTPPGAWKTARLHAAADPQHREDLARILDDVPERHRLGVVSNALRSSGFQAASLQSLLAWADSLQGVKRESDRH